MGRKISYKQAINEALDLEMRRDPTVIVLGEDIVGGAGAPGEADAWGGVLGVTKGLISEFGPTRVLDTRGGYKDYFRGHLPTAHHLEFDTLRGTENAVPVQYLPEDIIECYTLEKVAQQL